MIFLRSVWHKGKNRILPGPRTFITVSETLVKLILMSWFLICEKEMIDLRERLIRDNRYKTPDKILGRNKHPTSNYYSLPKFTLLVM